MYASPYDSGYQFDETLVCITCASAIFWALVAVYTFHKAERLEMDPWFWSVAVFLLGIFFFIPFIIVSASQERKLKNAAARFGGAAGFPVARGGSGYPTGVGPKIPIPADPDFRDYHLDDLIEDGQLREARKYLKEMTQMAKEMNDDAGYQNYKQYEAKINAAATRSTNKRDW